MSASFKGPFRFTALPPELQVEIAEHLPMKALQNLSLTTKQIREHTVLHSLIQLRLLKTDRIPTQAVVLFKKIGTPLIAEPIALPATCLLGVQDITCVLQVRVAGSRAADWSRRLFDVQSIVLPQLVHLRKAQLDILVDYDVQLETLQIPLVMIQSAISAFAAICKPALLEASLVADVSSAGACASIVLAILNTLSHCGFSVFTMRPLVGDCRVLFRSETLSKAFQHLANHLQSLELHTYWLGITDAGLALPHVRKLRIYQDYCIIPRIAARALLATLPSLLNACGSSLRSFDLDVNSRHLLSPAEVDELAKIHSKSLASLRLAGTAFDRLHCVLRNLRCDILAVTVTVASTWQELHNLINTVTHPPKSIRIDVNMRDGLIAWQDSYKVLRQSAQRIGIVLTVNAEVVIRIASPTDLHEGLRGLASDLLAARFHLANAAFDSVAVYAANIRIHLQQCTKLNVAMDENLNTNFLGSPSLMFSALMHYVEAPQLQALYLDFTSPLSDYLPSLVDAIARNALPALGTIQGSLGIVEDLYSEEGDCPPASYWRSGVGAVRKALLERICSERGICLEELAWC